MVSKKALMADNILRAISWSDFKYVKLIVNCDTDCVTVKSTGTLLR